MFAHDWLKFEQRGLGIRDAFDSAFSGVEGVTVYRPSLARVTGALVRKDLSSKIYPLARLITALDATPEHVALTSNSHASPGISWGNQRTAR
ncbi:hypothetical protein AB0F91_26995 [Amycolatopsis sp. NPDC023774]|uniref:hypothetical protein n=1 Tax=Amycolatopsis sp. NPDC023774 TaxID=3155015 RepID=UPI0033DFE86E